MLRNEADVIYEVGELCSKDAFQLFLYHAFRRTPLTKNYEELIGKVLHYAKGVPLAIKVLVFSFIPGVKKNGKVF